MLTHITNDFFIDFDDIYLVDTHTWADTTLIYLKRFERIPLELKDADTIYKFKLKLTQYLHDKECYAKELRTRRIPEDERSTGEDILELSIA